MDYYGFDLITKSWKLLPDARTVDIAGRRIIISRLWAHPGFWTATEPETGAGVLSLCSETAKEAIKEAELSCSILEDRWQEAITSAKATPGWHPCPYLQGEGGKK